MPCLLALGPGHERAHRRCSVAQPGHGNRFRKCRQPAWLYAMYAATDVRFEPHHRRHPVAEAARRAEVVDVGGSDQLATWGGPSSRPARPGQVDEVGGRVRGVPDGRAAPRDGLPTLSSSPPENRALAGRLPPALYLADPFAVGGGRRSVEGPPRRTRLRPVISFSRAGR